MIVLGYDIYGHCVIVLGYDIYGHCVIVLGYALMTLWTLCDCFRL